MDPHNVASPRDIAALVVPRVGRVRATDDPVLPWVVVDSAGVPVGPVSAFLRDLLACGSSPASCRSYGYDLGFSRHHEHVPATAQVVPARAGVLPAPTGQQHSDVVVAGDQSLPQPVERGVAVDPTLLA